MTDKPVDNPVTSKELALELKAMRSEVRMWILAAVGLNAFLANAHLPSAVTIPAIGLAIGAPTAKAALAFLGHR
jgi:hypothetical protein